MTNELYDLNYEVTLLSSLFFSPDKLPNIDADIFYSPIHKSIYLTLQALEQQDLPRDEHIVHKHLIKQGISEDMVSDALLRVMSANSSVNIQPYIDKLEEYRKVRDIKTTLYDIHNLIQEGKEADEIEATLLSLTEKIVNKTSIDLFNLTPASQVEARDSEFITPDFIPVPKRTVSIFSAGGGTGKTSLLLQLAMHYLNENPDEKAFCWLSEDPLGLTKYRLNRVISGLYPDGAQTLHRLILSEDLTFPTLVEQNRMMSVNSLFYKMKMILKDYSLIIFDPLIAFYGGDENNNAHAKLFMQLFTKWANEEDKTIIFIHHSTKNSSQARGASAFIDAARAVYEIEKIKDDDGKEVDTNKRKVSLTKDNYRASFHFGGFSKEIEVFPNEDDKRTVSKMVRPALVTEYVHEESNDDELGIS